MRRDELEPALREVRRRYDMELTKGDRAILRRCPDVQEVRTQAAFYAAAKGLAQAEPHLAHVVMLFPHAEQRAFKSFRLGAYARRFLGDQASAKRRMQRVLAAHDRDELDRCLRHLLLSCGSEPVDWGALGVDVLWFFADSGRVRGDWAQDFYAPVRPLPAGATPAEASPAKAPGAKAPGAKPSGTKPSGAKAAKAKAEA